MDTISKKRYFTHCCILIAANVIYLFNWIYSIYMLHIIAFPYINKTCPNSSCRFVNAEEIILLFLGPLSNVMLLLPSLLLVYADLLFVDMIKKNKEHNIYYKPIIAISLGLLFNIVFIIMSFNILQHKLPGYHYGISITHFIATHGYPEYIDIIYRYDLIIHICIIILFIVLFLRKAKKPEKKYS